MTIFKSTTHLSLLTMTLAALVAASSVAAQSPAAPRLWNPNIWMGPGMMDWPVTGSRICDRSISGLAEWRFDRLENAIWLTEAQRSLLAELKAASAKAAETVSRSCPREIPQSPIARMDVMERRLDVMLEAVKSVRPALEAFYSSLTDEQRIKLSSVIPRNWSLRHWLWPSNQS